MSSLPTANAQTPGWTPGSGQITTSDNIGIGTASPTAQLHVFGGTALFTGIGANGYGYGAFLRDTAGTEGYCCGTVVQYTGNSLIRISNLQIGSVGLPLVESTSTAPLYLNLYNPTDVQISQSAYSNGLRVEGVGASSFLGSVGIGTRSPGAKLEVDSGLASDGIRLLSGNASSYTAYSLGRTGIEMYLGVAAAAGQYISNSVAGDIAMRGQGGKLLFSTSPTGLTNDLSVSGNAVGIGTSAPNEKLDVNGGNIRVTNTGGAYNGMIYSGDPNWGFSVVHPASPADDFEVRLNYYPNPGGNRRAGIYNVGSGSYALYADSNASPNIIVPANLAIGTTVPSALLTVGAAGGAGTKVVVNGDISMTGNINAKYQDVAEWVPASTHIPPGTVVVLDPNQSNQVMPSQHAYDSSVAGVVSNHPGVILGEAASSKEKVATTGRVKVRVDATSVPIRIGDLLVTSDHSGMAMRSQPIEVQGVKMHRPGTLIGKALEPLDSGEGEILVLLSLQ